jgi:hypothetical protein
MNRNLFVGAILIVLGALLVFSGGEAWSTGTMFTYFWPTLFVIPVGVFLHWMYFSVTNRRGVGLLIPGGILVTTGVVCQISMLFDSWAIMWPGFILAVAVGLFEFYWMGSRNRYLLIPINILTALSAIFFVVFTISSLFSHLYVGKPILAMILILVGAFILFFKKKELV